MPEKPYRIALVGCGDIAETGHVPSLLAHERFQLVALCDIRRQRAELLAAKAGGAEVLTDYRPLLDRADLDAVLLALHPEHSVAIAEAFLRHGKPVLDEKPLAVSLEAGRRLASVVEETRGVYQVGFVLRYAPVIERVAECSRRIGSPAFYRIEVYDERLDRSNREHFDRIQNHGLRDSSPINHEGSHIFDFFQLWNPSPYATAQATAVRTEPDFYGPNLWSIQMTLEDGSVLGADVGWFVPEIPSSGVLITGPGGTLQIDLFRGEGEFRQHGRAERIEVPGLKPNWQRQLDLFAQAIESGQASTATVYDGLRSLAASQACERAHRTGSIVRLADLG